MIDATISVCSKKDLPAWSVTAMRLPRAVPAKRHIICVPDADLSDFERVTPSPFEILPESNFVQPYYQDLRDRILRAENGARFGWYLQQFIKISLLEYLQNQPQVVIWDADTIPCQKLRFFEPDGTVRYFEGHGYHDPYFELAENVLGVSNKFGVSFIAQSIGVTSATIQAFLEHLTGSNPHWSQILLEKIDFSQESGVSEYELIGVFATSLRGEKFQAAPGYWIHHGGNIFPHPSRIPLFKYNSRLLPAFIAYECLSKPPGRLNLRALIKEYRVLVGRLLKRR